jgi:hypothetical protein
MLIIFIFLLVSQYTDIVSSKIANCFVETIIIELFDFERNAQKISGFEHISSKIRDIERIILLKDVATNIRRLFATSNLILVQLLLL